MKKLFVLFLALVAMFSLVSCSSKNNSGEFKVGVILVGDAKEGYTLAHIEGIQAAIDELGLKEEQVIWKESVGENDSCKKAAEDLVAAGCKVIFSNSYGHQDYMYQVAKKNSDVQFVACTGDYAAISKLANYKNAFTDIYEARYVSGVVAGLKLKELENQNKLSEANKDESGNWKIGYVGAYTYAEVISGFTAFYLGVKSIVENVSMSVKFTSSWFNPDAEAQAAEALVNSGCVIIGQHADSTGAPSKCEALLKSGKVCYSVGYNVDMLSVAPNAALTSATNNWGAYYTYAIKQAMDNKAIETNWHKGFNGDAVAITELGSACPEGTDAKVAEVVNKIKNGELHVFDCSKFTVDGNAVTEVTIDLSYINFQTKEVIFEGETFNAIKTDGDVSYFEESVKRSAPYFALKIDGIKWLNK